MIFEQDPEQILSAILPLYFNGQLLRQMQESVASELAVRAPPIPSPSSPPLIFIKVCESRVFWASSASGPLLLMASGILSRVGSPRMSKHGCWFANSSTGSLSSWSRLQGQVDACWI